MEQRGAVGPGDVTALQPAADGRDRRSRGQVRRLVGRRPGDRAGDLVGVRRPAHRHHAGEPDGPFGHALGGVQAGVGRSGYNADHAHALCAELANEPDRWFRTGDLGVFDEQGNLRITGRLQERFVVGGSNAYPAEIERLPPGIPQVKRAVVVGVPHARLGEVGYAFVQPREPGSTTAEQLLCVARPMMADPPAPGRWWP